jgi:DNA-binding response OmpR family regulator
MARHTIDLLILDLKLPGEDGMQIARNLRAESDVPIIILTGRKDEADRVMGLELGADDYLTKPFSPRELLARIRALLRRAAPTQTPARLRVGQLELDFSAREVTVAGKRRVLTHHEFELLATLARAAGRVLSREQILDALKGHAEAFDRSIDVHIAKIRAKLEPDPKEPRFIKTVRGVGYLLARPPD